MKILILSLVLSASVFEVYATTSTAPESTAPAPASTPAPVNSPIATPITNADGESYLDAIRKAGASFSHREIFSAFSEVSKIPLSSPNANQAVICIQKTSHGVYRNHSHNHKARGLVASAGDLAAFSSLFSLEPNQKFLLNVPSNLDGTGNIVTYIGQVLVKDGPGDTVGDMICFARYLQVAPASSTSSSASSSTSTATAPASSTAVTPATTTTTTSSSS